MEVFGVHLLLFAILVYLSGGQPIEHLCSSNSSGTGQLQVTLLLNINYGPECKQRNPRWRSEAIAEQRLKWQSKGIDIGINIIDTCSDPDITAKVISEMVPYSWTVADPLSGGSNNSVCTASGDEPINIGFISETLPTGYDGTTPGLLGQVDIPLILASDDPISTDDNLVVADSTENHLLLMAELMVEMDWDFVTVVYSEDLVGQKSLELFQNISLSHHICIDKYVAVSYTSALETLDIQTVGVVLLGSEGIGLHLLQRLSPSSQVWVTTHDIRELKLEDGVKVYSVTGEENSQYIASSLVSLSNALKQVGNKPNCLAGNSEQCTSTPQFRRNLMRELREEFSLNLLHTINKEGQVVSVAQTGRPSYSVMFHNSDLVEVGETTVNGSISTFERFEPEPSMCLGDCRIKCAQFNEDKHTTYIHGKWAIVVFVPIHESADINDPWSCVNFTKTRLFRTEAAVYAFEYLKTALTDNHFGLLILDSCGYKLKPAGDLYDAIRGIKTICNHKKQCFDPDSVVQVIADYSSAITQQLQTVTREMPVIQMAYGASSVTLNQRENYPYFLRTNPSDDLQAHFMVELLKSFQSKGSNINAVNIVYTDGLYGKTGAERVKLSLAKAGICVHLERKVNVTATDNNFEALVSDLIYRSHQVKITVLFVDPEHITDLMVTVKNPAYKTAWINRGLSFLLSDTWNDDPDLLTSYGDIMRGSFSFSFNSDFTSNSFTSHLKKIKLPSLDNSNYWLSTLVQETGECKIRGNFHSTYTKVCGPEGAELTHLEGESYSSHLMKAITATIYGLRGIALDKSPTVLFDDMTIQSRYNKLLDVSIPSVLENNDTRNHKPFTDAGNGKVGYSIYNIKLEGKKQKPTYVLVQRTGSGYQDELGNFRNLIQFYDENKLPSSRIQSTVSECTASTTAATDLSPTASSSTNQDLDGLKVGLIVVSVVFILFLIIVVVAIAVTVICCRKKWRMNKQSHERTISNLENRHRKDGLYDEIPYMHYMSQAQKESILKFVAENPGTAPPSYMLSSEYYTNQQKEPEYHIPKNNQLIPEAMGLNNPAFCGSEASGTSRTTGREGSLASGSTLSASKLGLGAAYDTGTANRNPGSVPVPAPRANLVAGADGGSGSGANYAVLTAVSASPLEEAEAEEEDTV